MERTPDILKDVRDNEGRVPSSAGQKVATVEGGLEK
jgi:hypothetical protein